MFTQIKVFFLSRLEQVVFASVIALQAAVFLLVPTDFNGDPNDYIYSAQNLTNGSGISTIRFAGYPLFLFIFSGNLTNLNFVFLTQSVLFIICLKYFAKSISNNSIIRALIYIPALIPAIAYSQKLLFPDGLILSLLLLWISLLIRKKLNYALLVLVLLVFIKLVFVGLFLIYAVYVLKLKKPSLVKFHKLIHGTGFALMIPALFAIYPFYIYMPVVQQAPFQNVTHNSKVAIQELGFECNHRKVILKDADALSNIYVHSVDVYNSPLSPSLVQSLGCSSSDLNSLRRQLVVQAWQSEPNLQLFKFLDKFSGALVSRPQTYHLDYMLGQKSLMREQETRSNFSYANTEIDSFGSRGITPLEQPGDLFVKNLPKAIPVFDSIKSITSVVAVALLLLVFVTRTKLSAVSILLTSVWVYIAFATSAFAWPVDRYLFSLPFIMVALTSRLIFELRSEYFSTAKARRA